MIQQPNNQILQLLKQVEGEIKSYKSYTLFYLMNSYQFYDLMLQVFKYNLSELSIINILKSTMSTNNALRRIRKDIDRILKEAENGMMIDFDESDLFNISALMQGPEKTPWQGGSFELAIKFSEEYPNKCPEVVFKTQMFHPNIYADGRICLDILNTQWSAVYDTWAILISIRSLLSNPNPQSPANKFACDVYMNNKIDYQRRVKQIVQKTLQDNDDE